MKLFLALVVAACWELWKTASGIRTALKSAKEKPTIVPEIKDARLKHCREKCPIYYAKLGTCGSPFMRKDWKKPTEPLGCFCHMETKAGTECNCWLYDQTEGEHGWPHGLNSHPFPPTVVT